MITKTVYVDATQYKNLTAECLVLLRSFYYGIQFESTEILSVSDISIQFIEEQLFIEIPVEEISNDVYSNQFFETESGKEKLVVSIDQSKDLRLFVKQTLYDFLSEHLNRHLPWGILQGIRPTKLVFKLLKKYDGKEIAVLEELVTIYRLSTDMANLCLEVVRNEMPYVTKVLNREKHLSVYIGIPFCPSRCLYCSFTSNEASKWAERMDDYVDCLLEEWDGFFLNQEGYSITSIYIGGGTPTTLSSEQFEHLLSHINQYVPLDSLEEFTIEAGRPDTITEDKLDVFKKYYVTRLSINPQTMHQRTLQVIGRNHTVEDIYRAYSLARQKGDWRINMDIIVGLPGEEFKDVVETLEQLIELNPDELTVHTLAIKRFSRLHEQLEQYPLVSYEIIDSILAYIRNRLKEVGFKPYYLYRQKNIAGGHENVGYYRGETSGIYNMLIMEEIETIVGFGAGTVTKIVKGMKVQRIENPKNVKIYMERGKILVNKKRANL